LTLQTQAAISLFEESRSAKTIFHVKHSSLACQSSKGELLCRFSRAI
jgi:hypothetical protein